MLPRIWCQILSNKTQWVSLHPLLWWACPVLPECEMLLSWFSSFWSEYIYDKEQCIFQCKEYIVGVLKGGDINSGVGYIYWEHFPRVEFWIWNCCFRQLERKAYTFSMGAICASFAGLWHYYCCSFGVQYSPAEWMTKYTHELTPILSSFV